MTYRRKVRISDYVIDRNDIAMDNVEEWNPNCFIEFTPIVEELNPNCFMGFPPIYVVEVQVKVLFFWITIWGDRCEFSDADARNKINSRAKAIYDAMSK